MEQNADEGREGVGQRCRVIWKTCTVDLVRIVHGLYKPARGLQVSLELIAKYKDIADTTFSAHQTSINFD